jgi:serine/threonine protein kinase
VDAFEDDANVYIVMELCAAGSMMDLLKRKVPKVLQAVLQGVAHSSPGRGPA